MSLPAQPLSANCPRRREQSHLFLRGLTKRPLKYALCLLPTRSRRSCSAGSDTALGSNQQRNSGEQEAPGCIVDDIQLAGVEPWCQWGQWKV